MSRQARRSQVTQCTRCGQWAMPQMIVLLKSYDATWRGRIRLCWFCSVYELERMFYQLPVRAAS